MRLRHLHNRGDLNFKLAMLPQQNAEIQKNRVRLEIGQSPGHDIKTLKNGCETVPSP
jgi:hypothetical protein